MRATKSTNEIRKKIAGSVERLCRKKILDKKEIILFGCTMWAKTLMEYLRQKEISISAIVDNNPQKAGGKCQGINVYLPEEYLKSGRQDVCILICSSYWLEMSGQLEEMGYVENRDFFVLLYKRDKLCKKEVYVHVMKGYLVYQRLMKPLKGSKNPFLFLCPYGGSGDIYMAGIFFRQYIKREEIDKYLFLVEGSLAEKTAALFQIPNVRQIQEEEKTDLLDAYQFFGKEYIRLKPLLYWGWRVKSYPNPDAGIDITFLDVMKYDVFRHKKEIQPRLPQFKRDNAFLESLFLKKNLKKGKTVILAPYAGSFQTDITADIWEYLADKLLGRGFCVCTNSAGEEEPVIKGTVPIFFPLEYAVPVLDYAGYFIGVRSGFCDITSSSSCKFVILYERALNAVKFEYFSFVRMGLNQHAAEFVYGSEDKSIFAERVLKEIMSQDTEEGRG